jgi:hypothetical protein
MNENTKNVTNYSLAVLGITFLIGVLYNFVTEGIPALLLFLELIGRGLSQIVG